MSEENANGITSERLRALLDYDPETGEFTWRVSRRQGLQGKRAGSTDSQGYLCIRIDGRGYKAHPLAWLRVFGNWPDGELDHANGDRADNRISNLRLATPSQNCANRRRYRTNTSGYKGVTFNRKARKWHAKIQKHGKSRHLGLFPTAADAHAAYCAAAREIHGEYWRAV
jgi:hypothetical protein